MEAAANRHIDAGRRSIGRRLLGLGLTLGTLAPMAAGLGGCAGSSRSRRSSRAPTTPAPGQPSVSRDLPGTDEGLDVVVRAMGLIGVPYQWGGNNPREGFDCSGLVTHVYREAIGMRLPRTSRLISERGRQVRRTRLAPGDLVFFNTTRQSFSHVGIYVGDDRFVHAPSSGSLVRVESMEVRYWRQRYAGARRLIDG